MTIKKAVNISIKVWQGLRFKPEIKSEDWEPYFDAHDLLMKIRGYSPIIYQRLRWASSKTPIGRFIHASKAIKILRRLYESETKGKKES